MIDSAINETVFLCLHTGIRCRNSWIYLVHLLYLYLLVQGRLKMIDVCSHLVTEWFSLCSGGYYFVKKCDSLITS
jgi:hypothetical protein